MTRPVTIHPLRDLRRLARWTVPVAGLAGVIVILATARAAQMPSPRPTPIAAAVVGDAASPDLVWSLDAASIQRVGYRHGKRQVLEVVPLGPTDVEVEVSTARAFLEMRAAATDAGVDLRLESGFRTVEQQRALFEAWRSGHGNKAARPGQSNHQSGRALDIAVAAPGALAWLENNAAAFHFIRTVANEPWHWEYVDVPVARGAAKHVWRKPVKSKAAKKSARRTRH